MDQRVQNKKPNYMTTEEVTKQKQRFEAFLKSVNLAKVGQRYFHFAANNLQDGRYNQYCYLSRILRLIPNVNGSMYHPELWKFYIDLLETKAILAFFDSIMENKK